MNAEIPQTPPEHDRPLTQEEMKKVPFQIGELIKWKGIWLRVIEVNFYSLKLEAVKPR